MLFLVEKMRSAGLSKGGSAENAVVFSTSKGLLNPPVRSSEEPCRHKILDFIGDVSLFARNGSQGVPVATFNSTEDTRCMLNLFADCQEVFEHQQGKTLIFLPFA